MNVLVDQLQVFLLCVWIRPDSLRCAALLWSYTIVQRLAVILTGLTNLLTSQFMGFVHVILCVCVGWTGSPSRVSPTLCLMLPEEPPTVIQDNWVEGSFIVPLNYYVIIHKLL